MAVETIVIPCLTDNYAYLLCDRANGEAVVIDPSDAETVARHLDAMGLRLTHILNTHHHHDHVGGNLALKARYQARVVGAAADRHRLPGLDEAVDGNTAFAIFGQTLRMIATPGHTSGALCYLWGDCLFCGDTLFLLGCGRLFEGTAAQMLTSLKTLATLPDATKVYCGHEYTASNARFALHVDPGNAALQEQAKRVEARRAAGKPSVPSTIADEKAANPFLRCQSDAIRSAMAMADAPEAAIFAALRARKDAF